MGSIKQLPVAVHSSLRSSVHLFDLARVVEELVYNSVDAGASKVLVFLNIGTCYVRIEDDGCGISRDGLVLLGEKYVTTKLQSLVEAEVAAESFTSRGETLGSLSHISLLEIITKARGRPNGYRKVIKGCRSLYLGINDVRKEVGTTVIVRDLYYNQPVRRKCMQSSPKKVLQTVKKCIFRIALVFPHIFLKLVDDESKEELFCALPSASSLPLVTSSFGGEIGNSLFELHFTEGLLKLSGYLSSPVCSSYRVLQYIYINSRPICKGAIHKLLSTLVTKFKRPTEDHSDYQNSKRHKTQDSSAYLLNLCCPQSVYDLTFEPSRTKVEFKDWPTVQAFIVKAVSNFWDNIQGKSCDCIPDGCIVNEMRKEHKCAKSKDLSTEELPQVFGTSVQTRCMEQFPASISDRASNPFHDIPEFDSDIGECLENYQRSSGKSLKYSSHGRQYQGLEYACETNFGFSEKVSKKRDMGIVMSDCMMNSPIRMNQMAPDIEFSDKSNFYSLKETDEKHGLLNREYDMDARLQKSFRPFEDNFLPESSKELPFNYKRHHVTDNGEKFRINSNDFRGRNEWVKQKSPLVLVDEDCQYEGSNYCMKSHGKDEEASQFSSPVLRRCRSSFISDSICSDFDASEDGGETFVYVPPRKAIKPWHLNARNLEHPANSDIWKSSRKNFSRSYLSEEDIEDEILIHKSESNSIMSDFLISQSEFGNSAEDGCRTISSIDGFLEELNKGGSCLIPGCYETNKDNEELPEAPLFTSKCKVKIEHTYEPRFKNPKNQLVRQGHPKRSLSAPPFFKERRKFSDLGSMIPGEGKWGEKYFQSCHDVQGSINNTDVPFRMDQLVDASKTCSTIGRKQGICHDKGMIKDERRFDKLSTNSIEESHEDMNVVLSKWRNRVLQHTEASQWTGHSDDILDISSGLLRHCGGLLVPEVIDKDFLDRATVLPQLDRKFIPVISNQILAVVDQHAADERIRLEELHQKVLSGDGKTVAYLDSEEELVIPEFGFQLLQNYAEQVANWGWICNTHTESQSFTTSLDILHKPSFKVYLTAVPCILGVKLSEKDLMDFLEQLLETDGSSTVPPAVHRILNSKACRGAIMFGDSLLPSECSIIVEELKKTSLCFQCAHGRPTTVPLVNLKALHKQIEKLGLENGSKTKKWHGLQHHKSTLERARLRLAEAGGG